MATIEEYFQGATDKMAINDAELHRRYEEAIKGQKWEMSEKACERLTYPSCARPLIIRQVWQESFIKVTEEE